MQGLLLPQSPRIIRAAHEFPRNLPVRADPRWGLHVVQPYQQSLPVGTGLIEGDPTPDWGWEPPVIVPPLPDPFSSSSEESSSQSSSQQSSSFSSSTPPSSSSTPPSSSSLEISSTITAAPSCCRDNVESATYTFNFSGGSPGTSGCTQCSTPFNKQFVLTYRSGTGDWRSAQFTSCSYFGGNTWHVIMSMSCQSLVPPHPASDHNRVLVQIQANSGITTAMVVYRTDFPMPHNCLLPFQVGKLTEPGEYCTGFPGTITLVPN